MLGPRIGERLVVDPYKAFECETIADRRIEQRVRDRTVVEACTALRRQCRRMMRTHGNKLFLSSDAQAAMADGQRASSPPSWPL